MSRWHFAIFSSAVSNVCGRIYVWEFVWGEMTVKGDAFASL